MVGVGFILVVKIAFYAIVNFSPHAISLFLLYFLQRYGNSSLKCIIQLFSLLFIELN